MNKAQEAVELAELEEKVVRLRVCDLKQLLRENNTSVSGCKTELIERVLFILRRNMPALKHRVRELHRNVQEIESRAASAGNSSSGTLHFVYFPPLSEAGATATAPIAPLIYQYRQQSANAVATEERASTVPPNFENTRLDTQHDIKMINLPFYEVLDTLIKPTKLYDYQQRKENSHFFHLTPEQATEIASNRDIRNENNIEHIVQVQLRFCLLETTSEQGDNLPANIVVKVNKKPCQMPHIIPTNKLDEEPKRRPLPVNVTTHVKLSPTVANHIRVTYNSRRNQDYAFGCYLVRKLTATQLLLRMEKLRRLWAANRTKELIREKLNEDVDCEIATIMLKVSLMCPLGKIRMTTPCRASTCSHLQCFDAWQYFQMNECKASWSCPVCGKPAVFDNLFIDEYFQEVLTSNQLTSEDTEIQLHQDGSWSIPPKQNDSCVVDISSQAVQRVVMISDDVEMIITGPPQPGVPEQVSVVLSNDSTSNDIVKLTVSDSEDGDSSCPTPTEDVSDSIMSQDSPLASSVSDPSHSSTSDSDHESSISSNMSGTVTPVSPVPHRLFGDPNNFHMNTLAALRGWQAGVGEDGKSYFEE